MSNYTFYYKPHTCHSEHHWLIHLVQVLLVNCENFSRSLKTLQPWYYLLLYCMKSKHFSYAYISMKSIPALSLTQLAPAGDGQFYCNIPVFLFNIKGLNILYILKAVWGVCTYVLMGRLCLSVRDVTKHRDPSPSPTSVNWVSDRVGINSKEIYAYQSVCFWCSIE